MDKWLEERYPIEPVDIKTLKFMKLVSPCFKVKKKEEYLAMLEYRANSGNKQVTRKFAFYLETGYMFDSGYLDNVAYLYCGCNDKNCMLYSHPNTSICELANLDEVIKDVLIEVLPLPKELIDLVTSFIGLNLKVEKQVLRIGKFGYTRLGYKWKLVEDVFNGCIEKIVFGKLIPKFALWNRRALKLKSIMVKYGIDDFGVHVKVFKDIEKGEFKSIRKLQSLY